MLVYITTVCPMCGESHEVTVYEDDYLRWCDGELAQVAFPYLNADEREMLISGICPTCWDKMFSFDEDEVEEAEDWFDEDEDEEEDEPDYEDELREADLEMGFNPYMGGYDYDC